MDRARGARIKRMRTILRIMPAAALALIFSFAAAAQERYLKPVDEGTSDAQLKAYRGQLIKAAEKRNAVALFTLVDSDIMLSFGGAKGIIELRKMWDPENKDSDLWPTLLAVLRNGGTFDRSDGKPRPTTFYAPYTYSLWPADLDSYEYAAIFGKDVNLREGPSETAKVKTRLSYNLVKTDSDAGSEWIKVRTLGGLTGYVNSEFIRSPLNYRAVFEKKGRAWKMTAFIAGD